MRDNNKGALVGGPNMSMDELHKRLLVAGFTVLGVAAIIMGVLIYRL
jgi:hypothetical protein